MSIMNRILGKKSSSFSVCFVWRNVNLLWDLYLPCFQFSGYVINFAVLLLMLSWAGWLQLPNQIQATRQNILRGGTQLCESRADLRGNCADMRQNRRARRRTETWDRIDTLLSPRVCDVRIMKRCFISIHEWVGSWQDSEILRKLARNCHFFKEL